MSANLVYSHGTHGIHGRFLLFFFPSDGMAENNKSVSVGSVAILTKASSVAEAL